MGTTKKGLISLKGELSIGDAEHLHSSLLSLIEEKHKKIVIDLSELEDIDVSIIQLLYAFYLQADTSTTYEVIGEIKPIIKYRLVSCGIISKSDLSDTEIYSEIIKTVRLAS
jgi:anti-anti-sigma regulatory factor